MAALDDDQVRQRLEPWRICDELTLTQAMCLIFGFEPYDPEELNQPFDYQSNVKIEDWDAVLMALKTGLNSEEIEGIIVRFAQLSPSRETADSVDENLSIVRVNSLRLWLQKKQIASNFFLTESRSVSAAYLDPDHPNYSPKMAACVSAWEAVEGQDNSGKSTKHVLIKWLTANASRFGLVNIDGSLNKKGIEECAKVANYRPGGGAPKTPTSKIK
jgi:hypothetical protein